jgi:hypothetical protein
VTVTARAIQDGHQLARRSHVRLNRAAFVSRRVPALWMHELCDGEHNDEDDRGLLQSSAHRSSSTLPESGRPRPAVAGNPARPFLEDVLRGAGILHMLRRRAGWGDDRAVRSRSPDSKFAEPDGELQFVDHRRGECGVGVNQQVDRVVSSIAEKSWGRAK